MDFMRAHTDVLNTFSTYTPSPALVREFRRQANGGPLRHVWRFVSGMSVSEREAPRLIIHALVNGLARAISEDSEPSPSPAQAWARSVGKITESLALIPPLACHQMAEQVLADAMDWKMRAAALSHIHRAHRLS